MMRLDRRLVGQVKSTRERGVTLFVAASRYSQPAMMVRIPAPGVAALAGWLAMAEVGAATTVLPETGGADAGLTRVACLAEDDSYVSRLRGVLVDVGVEHSAYEVVLTAAHGLPADVDALRRRCSVVDPEDRLYAIDMVWRPVPRGRGSVDDWAVLLTERRLEGDLDRVRVLAANQESWSRMARNEAPLRLPLRFSGGERACRLERPEVAGDDLAAQLFGHTCRAWSGHSGSPILTNVEGEAYLLGIHLGSRWIFERQASQHIGRYLDAEIIRTIRAAAAQGGRRNTASSRDRR